MREMFNTARNLLGAAALTVGLSACGGGPNDNVAACTEYVQKANAAIVECGGAPLYTVEETCPESIGTGPDCVEYYTCLGDAYACTTETQTLTANIANCSCGS